MPEQESRNDGQLLKDFAEKRDEAAFAELVRRHAPLVWNVCRRVLGPSTDADDAAQATFLALSRKAPQWRAFPSAGAWLHRVAHGVAVDVLRARTARERHEKEVATMDRRANPPTGLSDEQGALLHEELNALPEKQRRALILFHLEGKSLEQTAEIMARPKSTVWNWLAGGRERLKDRLARRGLVLSLAVLTSLLSAEAGAAEPPVSLVSSTTAAAIRFVAGNAGAGAGTCVLWSSSASLAEGALKKMYYAKLSLALVMVILFLSIGAGTGWVVSRASGTEGSVAKKPPVPVVAAPVKSPVAEDKPALAVTKEDLKALVDRNNAFALKMYAQLSAEEGNIFCSPFSISSALGMTYAGARGNTATEMEKALNFGLGQQRLHPAFETMNADLAGRLKASGQKLNIANGLCLTGGDVSDAFKALLQKHYGAETFGGDLKRINGWVKTKTEGKIEKILEQLSTNSVCVLLNAIYFKGFWERKFKESDTREQPFKVSSSKQVKAPLMYQEGEFKLSNKKDFQAVVLPYKGKKLSMVVVLPRAVEGLAALEKKLSSENLALWLSEMNKSREEKVNLYLPRFKVEAEYGLIPPFKKMGMKDAFEFGRADFRGMGRPKGELRISQIKHKAFCEVNEEGTEAAAVTALEDEDSAPSIFRADHPFFYLIRDNATGSILFMGRLVNPKV